MKNSTAIILTLISIGLFYTFIIPEYDKVQALRAEAAGYNDILDNVSDLSQKRDELLLKYNAIPKDQLANLTKILPDNVNVVELALNLDNIASKYGISIKSVRAVNDKTDESATIIKTAGATGLQKVKINFTFITTYANYRKFLADLEHSLRIIEVRNLGFSTAENSNVIEFQAQIETYWLK
jgi:hypothetical protein